MNGIDLYQLLWCHNGDLLSADPLRGEMRAVAMLDGLWSDVRDDATLTKVCLLTPRPTSGCDALGSCQSYFEGIKWNKWNQSATLHQGLILFPHSRVNALLPVVLVSNSSRSTFTTLFSMHNYVLLLHYYNFLSTFSLKLSFFSLSFPVCLNSVEARGEADHCSEDRNRKNDSKASHPLHDRGMRIDFLYALFLQLVMMPFYK